MSLGIPLVLAQSYWKRSSPLENTAILAILGLAGLVALIVIIREASKQRKGAKASYRAGVYSAGTFKRAAREAGLDAEETAFLEGYANALRVTHPEFLFQNEDKLDSFFHDVYRAIEGNSDSEGTADEKKATLFKIRESFARAKSASSPMHSTRSIEKGTPISFISPDQNSYPSVVKGVEAKGIYIEPARDAFGQSLRFRRGQKLSIFFYGKAREGYQFSARVGGFEDPYGKGELMLLDHSDAIEALPTRAHARRDTNAPCTFYRVRVTVKKGWGKEQRSTTVEAIGFMGTVTDISAGGLSIRTANPLPEGEYIKAEFAARGTRIVAFARVVRMTRLKASGGVMHLRFAKISRKALNTVLSFVYGYSE